MPLSGRTCPDCNRRVSQSFEKTITGREVCPDCAQALVTATTVGVVTEDVGSGMGVLWRLDQRIRRKG